MQRTKFILYSLIFLFSSQSAAFCGVLATEEDILRGRENLDNPVFTEVAAQDSGLAAAVKFILTGNPAMGDTAKAAVEEAVETAERTLLGAQCTFSDSASQKLYEALVMYDLVSGSLLWFTGERLAMIKSMKRVLDYYLSYDVYAWDDESWYLGATAMRIIASTALFALNFPDDKDYERYIAHSRTYLEKNLENSIDDYGAWITDSPGYVSYVLEYLIITAKAMRNAEVHNYFTNSRLQDVLTYEMSLLPPQQAPLVKGTFMIAGEGQTAPGVNHGITAVCAAADINDLSPEKASQLLWYWEQCGRPSNSLGLLYIDISIPAGFPDGRSCIVGGGMAVFRHNFGTPEGSIVFAGFGDAEGIPDRETQNHYDSGDFSFVWSGIPLVVHDGFVGKGCSESLMNSAPWRHNLVTGKNSGETPFIRGAMKSYESNNRNIPGNRKKPADYYPDGISQFLSTVMVDYVSGKVRLSERDMSAVSHYRHFLYLKPDALLIWDQTESRSPLEWNLWMPIETAGVEDNKLHLITGHGVDLEVLFTGDDSIDYAVEKPAGSITWDWPLVMRIESGRGTVTVSSLDFLADESGNGSTCGHDILRNILSSGKKPVRVGYNGSRKYGDILDRLGISYDYLSHRDLREVNLSDYSTVMIGPGASAAIWRMIKEHGHEIDSYVKEGGSVFWMCPTLSDWLGENAEGPVFVPAAMVPASCPVNLDSLDIDTWNSLKLYDDSLWREPHEITSQNLIDWIIASFIDTTGTGGSQDVSTDHTVYVPALWSDSWKVLASVRKTFFLESYSSESLGEPSRIHVQQPSSGDFFTLLLPRRIGRPFQFEVTDHGPGYTSLTDHTTTWEIKTIETSWTDANLSVLISTRDGIKGVYAFDCTYVNVGDERFRSEAPMSIYYSPPEGAGVIMSSSNNVISSSRVDFTSFWAGEVNVYDFSGDVWTDRVAFTTRLTAVDNSGEPVSGVRIYSGNRFIGSTAKDGTLHVRWVGNPLVVTLKYKSEELQIPVIPGEMDIDISLSHKTQ